MRIAIHDYAGHPFQFELSRELSRRGHKVQHLFFAGDRGPKGSTGSIDDNPVTLQFIPVETNRAYRKESLLLRLRDDIDYGRRVAKYIKSFKPDVVISGNTPIDAQEPILQASHQAGAGFVFWMQDFYSRAIKSILRNRWLGLGRSVGAYYEIRERSQLLRSDGVVVIGDAFVNPLDAWGVSRDRMDVIPNWGAIDSLQVRPKKNVWSLSRGLADRFVFLYSGTLGLKHDPALLVELADSFVDDPLVKIVIAASGIGMDRLSYDLSQIPRGNIHLFPLAKIEEFGNVLGSADVVIGLLEPDAGEFSIPSKILSYYCSGRPVLLSAPLGNLAAQLTRKLGAGEVVAAGDRENFIAAARRLRSDAGLRKMAGEAGRTYAERSFRIGPVADKFERIFQRAIATRNGGDAVQMMEKTQGAKEV